MDIYEMVAAISLFISIYFSIRELMKPYIKKYLPDQYKYLYPDETKEPQLLKN